MELDRFIFLPFKFRVSFVLDKYSRVAFVIYYCNINRYYVNFNIIYSPISAVYTFTFSTFPSNCSTRLSIRFFLMLWISKMSVCRSFLFPSSILRAIVEGIINLMKLNVQPFLPKYDTLNVLRFS